MTKTPNISEREATEIQAANDSRKPTVVFIHGLWLLASSWHKWVDLFEKEGFATVTANWPGDPETVAQANQNPQSMAKRSINEVADHCQSIIEKLDRTPILVGHSFGGLIVQILAGRGLAEASVAISPAPFRGVLPLPMSTLRSTFPVLSNPLNRVRTVRLSYDQFKYGFANAVDEAEARKLHAKYHVPAPGLPLFQAALANILPWTQAKVRTRAAGRGPLLIIAAEADHTVPLSISRASYRLQRKNKALTELVEMKGLGHSLVFDGGWEGAAKKALEFVARTRSGDNE